MELMMAVAIVAVLLALALEVGGYMRIQSERAGCAAHLRALHLFMNAYANDHNDRYPLGYISAKASGDKASTWTQKLRSYDGNLYRNPVTKEGAPYCPATRLNGVVPFQRDSRTWKTDYNVNGLAITSDSLNNQRKMISPQAIMFFDGGGRVSTNEGNANVHLRHGGRFNIIFFGGHVESAASFESYTNNWKP